MSLSVSKLAILALLNVGLFKPASEVKEEMMKNPNNEYTEFGSAATVAISNARKKIMDVVGLKMPTKSKEGGERSKGRLTNDQVTKMEEKWNELKKSKKTELTEFKKSLTV